MRLALKVREPLVRAVIIGLGSAAILAAQMAAVSRDIAPLPAPEPVPAAISDNAAADDALVEAVVPPQAELRPDSRYVADCLVEAVVQVESGGNRRMVGQAGERGLMQIKRHTWTSTSRRMFGRALPFEWAFNADLNRKVGRAYLAELQAFLQANHARWRSDERSLLLACYNAGPTRVQQAGFDLRRLPASTRSYIERATALHELYLAKDAARVRDLLVQTAIGKRLLGS